MSTLVTVSFVQGQQEAIAAGLPAEQAHVSALLERGVIESIHVAADRSRIWLVLPRSSPEQIRQVLSTFSLYPYLELELTPLLQLAPAGDHTQPPDRGPVAARAID